MKDLLLRTLHMYNRSIKFLGSSLHILAFNSENNYLHEQFWLNNNINVNQRFKMAGKILILRDAVIFFWVKKPQHFNINLLWMQLSAVFFFICNFGYNVVRLTVVFCIRFIMLLSICCVFRLYELWLSLWYLTTRFFCMIFS